MTIEFIDNKSKFFTDVKTLGRKYSATLGFMPEAVLTIMQKTNA